MRTPSPWRSGPPEEAPSPRVVDLLNQAHTQDDASPAVYAQVYQRVERTLQGRARLWRPVLAFAGAALVIAIAVVRLVPPTQSEWRTLSLGATGAIEVKATAVVRLEAEPTADEERVYVLDGEARAQLTGRDPERPFVLVTPHLRVVVVGTRFSVAVSEDQTQVTVHEGVVRVEAANGATVDVSTGDSLDSHDPRLTTPPAPKSLAPEPAPPVAPTPAAKSPDCDRTLSPAARKPCLLRLAAGHGLPAQNALYALGLFARDAEKNGQAALRFWREYQRRFALGSLAPEVGIAVLRELLTQKRYAEAIAEAESLVGKFPDDPRAFELALIRAKLLCTQFGRMDPALLAFAEALGSTNPTLREDALFARGACVDLLAGANAAQASWQDYLKEFANGPRADVVRARLSP